MREWAAVIGIWVAGCGGAASVPNEPEGVTAPPAAAEEERHLLEGCEQAMTAAGLRFECGGFGALLSRFSSEEAITSDVLDRVETDILAGMMASIEKGEVETHALGVDVGEAVVPARGFRVRQGEELVMVGSVMAVSADDGHVLATVCFTKELESTVCTTLLAQLLTIGLPASLASE